MPLMQFRRRDVDEEGVSFGDIPTGPIPALTWEAEKPMIEVDESS